MSFGELLFLLILALLVFGPRKLPEIARTIAKVMTDLRRASNEFRYTLEEEIHNIEVSEHPAPRLQAVPAHVDGAVPRQEEVTPVAEAAEAAATVDAVDELAAQAGSGQHP